MPSPTNQVQLTIVEDVLGELIVLEAPAAQIAIGPQLSDTAPVALGTAAAGTASSAARGDHVHAHGNLSGSSLHALASTSAAGFMSTAQFDLLAAATDDDDASTLVKRDSLGDFSAGTITADLTGNASTATNATTATKLSSTRNFAVTGDITGTVSSDLTAGASIATSIAAGVIVDADVNASAAIAGTKINPNFGTQTVDTSGLASLSSLMLAFAQRGASIGIPGQPLFGVGPAVTSTTPVGIGPHDYYPIDLFSGSFM
jgi:hypothetical protein